MAIIDSAAKWLQTKVAGRELSGALAEVKSFLMDMVPVMEAGSC